MASKLKILVLIPLIVINAGCFFKIPQIHTRTEFMMGGIMCSLSLFEKKEIAEKVFIRIREIEGKLSSHLKSSEISVLNRAKGSPVVLSGDAIHVIKKGLLYGELFNGLFDISIAPLVNLWGIGSPDARIPDADMIREVLPLVDYHGIIIQGNTVSLKRPGMGIDLGGIAKGYMADEAVRILRENGIKDALINLGGNIYVLGFNQEGNYWRVGIRDPCKTGDPNAFLGIVYATDKTLVTSGPYERFFEQNGKRYHHILDPRTGYPAESGLLSVTIIKENSLEADAFSTGVFIMGLEEGLKLVESRPGMEAIFVTDKKEIILTSGIKKGTVEFRLTSSDYTLSSR